MMTLVYLLIYIFAHIDFILLPFVSFCILFRFMCDYYKLAVSVRKTHKSYNFEILQFGNKSSLVDKF